MRHHRLLLAALAVGLAVPAAPALAQGNTSVEKAKEEKITDKNHPDYVRCRSESVIGSRAKKRRVCLTNAEWERVARDGNATANRIVDDNRGMPSGQGF